MPTSGDICPVCKGYGRLAHAALPILGGAVEHLDVAAGPQGLVCIACGGTGDYHAYREYTAYRMGVRAGFEAMARAMPNCDQMLGMDGVKAALDAGEREDV